MTLSSSVDIIAILSH